MRSGVGALTDVWHVSPYRWSIGVSRDGGVTIHLDRDTTLALQSELGWCIGLVNRHPAVAALFETLRDKVDVT